MIDSNLVKLSVLTIVLRLVATFKNNITRWIIKNWFTSGELPLAKWYTWEFIQALNAQRVFGLIVIASFTLITFPLGMWIASFRASDSWAVQNIIGYIVGGLVLPVNLFIMNKYINEMQFNRTTILGGVIVEVGCLAFIVGSYLIYRGNKP